VVSSKINNETEKPSSTDQPRSLRLGVDLGHCQ